MEPERDPAVEVTGDSKTQNTTDGDALMGYADETLVQEAPSSEEANATYSSLFVSNHPSPTISTLPPDLDDNRLSSTWEIELPAMDKSWEFVEDGQDIHIQDIVKRTRKSKRILEYLVRTKDGRRTTVSICDIIRHFCLPFLVLLFIFLNLFRIFSFCISVINETTITFVCDISQKSMA
jgi:hypothetical protein